MKNMPLSGIATLHRLGFILPVFVLVACAPVDDPDFPRSADMSGREAPRLLPSGAFSQPVSDPPPQSEAELADDLAQLAERADALRARARALQAR